MPNKFLLGIFVLSISLSAQAAQESQLHFSRAQFVTDLLGTPGVPKSDQLPSVLYKQRYAEGYLAGVMDAAEGEHWCRSPAIKPGELDELVWTILKMRPDNGASISAAKEVINVLRSRFPCQRKKP